MPADDQAALTGSSVSGKDVVYGAHCVVEGEINRRTGADGKSYAIGFQMRLPANWNGKFLFQGGGGPALDDFDPLTALENWCERGQASESMLAKGKAFAGKSQPLCVYPKIATYVRGDENDANSFVCK